MRLRAAPCRPALGDLVACGGGYRDQVVRLTTGARELLDQLDPAAAMRRWMDLFGNWIATKNGMLDTLLAMIESGEITHRPDPDRAPSSNHRHPR